MTENSERSQVITQILKEADGKGNLIFLSTLDNLSFRTNDLKFVGDDSITFSDKFGNTIFLAISQLQSAEVRKQNGEA